jgi:hypothetical protein
MDVVVEDEPFAQSMEAMFLEDLEGATEIVLNARQRVNLVLELNIPAGAQCDLTGDRDDGDVA